MSSNKPIFSKMELWFYPELSFVESRAQLKQLRTAYFNTQRRRTKQIVWTMVVATALGLMTVPVSIGLSRLGLSGGLMGAIQGGISGLVASLAVNYIYRRPYRRFIRQYLQEQGVPICLKCGYDLRGQTEPRCSECGEAFDPRLLATEVPDAQASSAGGPSL